MADAKPTKRRPGEPPSGSGPGAEVIDTGGGASTRVGPPKVGGKIGRFEILAAGAKGALGVEYRATDPDTGEAVTLRFLPELVVHAGEEVVRAFLQEARAAGQVRHANLLRLLKVGKDGADLFIVCEHCSADSLSEYLAANGPMAPREATRVARETALALAAVHKCGLSHRDVQPGNILRGMDGQVRLSGLGLVRAAEELQQFRLGLPLATPQYCSPELYQGGNIDGRTDIYSLGATYYTLLTGAAPYTADTSMQVLHKHTVEPVPDPRILRPELPEACFKFIQKAMAKRPEDRFATAEQTAGELARLLEKFPDEAYVGATIRIDRGALAETIRTQSVAAVSATDLPRTAKEPGGKGPWVAAAALVVGVGLIGAAVVALKNAGILFAPEKPKTQVNDTVLLPDEKLDRARHPTTDPIDAEKDKGKDAGVKTKDGGTEPIVRTVEPTTPPPQPAEVDTVRLFNDRLRGWRQDPVAGWAHRPGSASIDKRDGEAKLTAKMPATGFDLTFTPRLLEGDAVMLRFQYGRSGHCELNLKASGVLRLSGIDPKGNVQHLAAGTVSDPKSAVLRLLVDGPRIAVFAGQARLLHTADAPAPDPDDRRLSLVSVKAKSEFRDAVWSPRVRAAADKPEDLHAAAVETRRIALVALSQFGDPAALDRQAALVEEPKTFTAAAPDVLAELRKSKDPKAVDAIRVLAGRDEVPADLTRLAVEALADQTGAAPYRLVEIRLVHANGGVRAAAALSLAQVANAGPDRTQVAPAVARLEPMLGDADVGVRRAVMRALGRLKAGNVIPRLIAATRDDQTRAEAIEALANFPDNPAAMDRLLYGLTLAEPARSFARAGIESAGAAGRTRLQEFARAGRFTPEVAAAVRDSLYSGVVRDWHLMGTFNIDVKKDAINVGEYNTNPDPKKKHKNVEGKTIAWKAFNAPDGHVDLGKAMGTEEKRTAYAMGRFNSDADAEIDFRVTVDDDLTLWVNGAKAGTAKYGAERVIRAKLKQGANNVMVRVDNSGGSGWHFSLRTPVAASDELIGPSLLQLFDEDLVFIEHLKADQTPIRVETKVRFSGGYAVKCVKDRGREKMPGWSIRIAENPRPGEYRFMTFAWKKEGGGTRAGLRLSADTWAGHGRPGRGYFAGKDPPWAGTVKVAETAPGEWQIVTVDLFRDFGAFTLTGIGLNPVDGGNLFVDRMYLTRSLEDVKRLPDKPGT